MGIGGASGPFDWLVSDIGGVMETLENDFSDFLKDENLIWDSANPFVFRDVKYGFSFVHEIEYNYQQELDDVRVKYRKRIDDFRRRISEPSCFIRTIHHSCEAEFISNHMARIENAVKKYNPENHIIFLALFGMEAVIDFPVYYVKEYSTVTIDSLRGLFDSNRELLGYLDGITDENERNKNIIFNLNQEINYLKIVKKRYDTLNKVINWDMAKCQLPPEIVIYGAGNVGKALYRKIKNKCRVKCFVDKNMAGGAMLKEIRLPKQPWGINMEMSGLWDHMI